MTVEAPFLVKSAAPAPEPTEAARSEVQSLYDGYVVPLANRGPTAVRGKGRYAWDDEGRRYLDLGGGVAVNSLGHAHPAMRDALARQADALIHSCNLYYNENQGRMAKRLGELTRPGQA